MVLLADTEDRYNELLSRFQGDYSAHPDSVKAEGVHAKLKRFLGSNTGNLETCWEKMHDLLETSLNAIKASFEKSVNVFVLHRYKSPVFQFLQDVVSIAALDKVLKEMKTIGEYGIDPLLCGCIMRTKCGLPCAHEINEYIHSSEPISVDKVDRFWRKLDMEPLERVEVDVGCDIGNRWLETWSEVNKKFTNADESERLLMLKRFREIVNPSTTSLVEPEVQYKTRGRPKKTKSKADTSMKREKSAFEYMDSLKDSCSPVEGAFVFEVHPSSNAMFSTTCAQKQQVVRRKKTKDILPTFYIDQMSCAYQSFLEKIEDVKEDGHCGFRVITSCLFGNEDSWNRVHCDILYELRKNHEEWKRCFLEIGRWEIIEEAGQYFEESADPQYWFVLPDMGHVILTIYNVILVTLGGRYPMTFLPLFFAPSTIPRTIYMALVKYDKSKSLNHFVRVFLTPGHSFPPISLQWRENRNNCAIGWEDFVN